MQHTSQDNGLGGIADARHALHEPRSLWHCVGTVKDLQTGARGHTKAQRLDLGLAVKGADQNAADCVGLCSDAHTLTMTPSTDVLARAACTFVATVIQKSGVASDESMRAI